MIEELDFAAMKKAPLHDRRPHVRGNRQVSWATFQRVTYDVRYAAAAIRATELPHEFAADLETKGVPHSVSTRS